ncbi:hypothetical protein BHE74_00030738 [Ensete ventricosum]|nr:hypothetical protein BHE74_00030738 [Ensete ventricosum]
MRRDLPSRHRGFHCHLQAPTVPLYAIAALARKRVLLRGAVAPLGERCHLARALPLLVVTPASGRPGRGATPIWDLGRSRPPLQRALSWPATPACGLVMAG